jgi:hypothetical protein
MSYRVEFPSLINSETIRFIFDSSQWGEAHISPFFLCQEKRNDPDSGWRYPSPIDTKMVGEYFTSFAAALMEDDKLVESFRYRMPSEPSEEDLIFASKIVYKAGKKTKYFSRSFKRVSAVKSKQYDKRWEPITESMDGSSTAMLNFLLGDYSRDTFTRYIFAHAIRKWIYSNSKQRRKYYMDKPAEVAGWTTDYHENYAIDSAWEAVKLAMSIHEQKQRFKSNQEQYVQHAMVSKLEN